MTIVDVLTKKSLPVSSFWRVTPLSVMDHAVSESEVQFTPSRYN